MISSRVVQVFAPLGAEGLGRSSSGIVLAPGLVLTVRHGLAGLDGDPKVRLLEGDPRWYACDVAWIGDERCDAALLRVREGEALGASRALRLGRLVGQQRVGAVRAVGFPWAQVVSGERIDIDLTEAIQAAVDPLSGRGPDGGEPLLVVHIDGSVPSPRDDGGSPWQGMSGAALLRDDVVLGVIVVDPDRFGPDRLGATAASTLAAIPAFRAALTGDGAQPLELVDVELIDLLEAPYEPDAARGMAPSPAILLDSRTGVVGFRGRDDELAQLEAWCAGEPAIGVALVSGPAGFGKTRLVAELCRRLRRAGMSAGFAPSGADARAIAGVSATATTVVAIDEAHRRPKEVEDLLLALAGRSGGGPVRVVLVARSVGDWWTQTVADALADSTRATAAHGTAMQLALGPVDATVQDRHDAFVEAADAFAGALAVDVGELEVPDLSDPAFGSILYVHLAALRALQDEEPLFGGLAREQLLVWALGRERRYWVGTAAAARPPLELEDTVLERAVAVATLTIASDEAQAAAALATVPDLADEARMRRATARWLRGLYPRPEAIDAGWFSPLSPDELGDVLVAGVVGDCPAIVGGLLADQPHHVLSVLVRAAHEHADVAAHLEELVTEHLATIWPAAIAVAQESGGVLGSLLARAVERADDVELARAMLRAIPDSTVALRELAMVASEQVVRADGASAVETVRDAALRAAELQRYASKLAAVGRYDEALAAGGAAVALFRGLFARDPETFARYLAGALNDLSNRLNSVNRFDDAVLAGEEALALRLALVEEHPELLPDLATSLNNVSSDRAKVGRYGDALDAAERALEHRRALAAASPGDFEVAVAQSLINLSNRLTDLERYDEALEATAESVSIRRRLAEQAPDAHLAELAVALGNYSVDLRAAGRHEDAVATAEESIALYRRMDAQAPGAFASDHASALRNLSCALTDLARDADALHASEDAVAILRGPFARNPRAFAPDLVASLRNLAVDFAALGREEEAGAARAEAQWIQGG
jgi:AAA ATPase domain/Tetratricopeptide repeat